MEAAQRGWSLDSVLQPRGGGGSVLGEHPQLQSRCIPLRRTTVKLPTSPEEATSAGLQNKCVCRSPGGGFWRAGAGSLRDPAQHLMEPSWL